MRKDSLAILILALVVSAGVVGAVYYFGVVDASARAAPIVQEAPDGNWKEPPDPVSTAAWTDTPIECPSPNGGTFWTNAARCEDADLDNRISRADPVKIYRQPAKASRSMAAARSRTASTATKPGLRGPGKSPPSGLPPECRFPVGRALEIERPLSVADDPKESGWLQSYCRFRREAIEDGCSVADSYYYYSYYELCQ